MNTLALLFPGQGSQLVGMGQSLYEHSALAKKFFNEANEILGFDLKTACFSGPTELLMQTSICQPALYVHGYILFELLQEQNLLNGLSVLMGNSLGELTALAAAGAFDFEQGLKVVAKRGRLMQEACESTQGAMAAVIGGERREVEALCDEFELDISNINSPGQVVISGQKEQIDAVVAVGKSRGFKSVIPLKVAGAYHSRLMEPARVAFEKYLEGLSFAKPQWTVFTNVNGEAVKDEETIKSMLVRQIVSTVEWVKCMEAAKAMGVFHYLECGPGSVLAGLARRIDSSLQVKSLGEYHELELATF